MAYVADFTRRRSDATSPCAELTQARKACQGLYGKQGEECVVQEVLEKRCVATQVCPVQARAYYGADAAHKGPCASVLESSAFSDPSRASGDVIAHHLQAREAAAADPKLRLRCRAIAHALTRCMHEREKLTAALIE